LAILVDEHLWVVVALALAIDVIVAVDVVVVMK